MEEEEESIEDDEQRILSNRVALFWISFLEPMPLSLYIANQIYESTPIPTSHFDK